MLICSGDHDDAGGRARGARSRRRDRTLAGATRIDDALKRQQRAKERFLAAPVAPRAVGRSRARGGARPRRASRDRRRDGALSVMLQAARRSAPGDPHRASSRPPARSTATSSTAASPRSRGSDSSRSTTNRSSQRGGYVAGLAESARRAIRRRVAAIRRLPALIARSRRLRQRAGAAAARSRRGAARAQAVHRLQRPHVAAHVSDRHCGIVVVSRADARRPARPAAPTATIARLVRARAVPREPLGELTRARRSRRSAPARRPGCCSAAR